MLRRSLALLLLAASAFAQEAIPPNRFVPASAQVVMRVKAPAVWHEQFAKTRLAKVFAGEALAPIMKKARDDYQPSLDRAAAAGMPREVLQAFIENYRGELVVSVQFDVASVLDTSEPQFVVMLVLSPDRKYDLPALAAALRRIHKSGVATKPLAIGDRTFQVTTDRRPTTRAEMVDDHLVMFFGSAIERLAPAMLAPSDRSERPQSTAPFSLHVELAPIVDALVAKSDSPERERLGLPSPSRLLEVFGLGCFDCFDLALEPDGEHVIAQTDLGMRSQRGYLHDLIVVDKKRPSILRYVPPSASSFGVSAFDFAALLHLGQAAAEIESGDRESFAEFEASFFAKNGVRLREDLLDHLGGELLTIGNLADLFAALVGNSQKGARLDANRLLAEVCVGVAMRDGKAFAASLDKVLRVAGLLAGRKTEDYRGAKIHELHLGGAVTIEYAVTDDLALVVSGPRGDGSDYLRAALDARADCKGAPPDAITKRFADLPAGWSGIGVLPILDLARKMATLASAAAPDASPQLTDAVAIVRSVCDELKALGLGDLVSASYASREGVRTIYRW
jgi:hypothetical protein